VGKSSAEIEYDIERQRQRLTARVSRLDRRIRDDIESVKDEARERAQRAQDKARDAASRTRDMAKERASEARDGEHPGAVAGIAFGTGALLGWVTGGGDDEEERRERGSDRRHSDEERRSRIFGMVSSVFHSAVSTAGSQSAGLAKTAAKKGATTAVKSVRPGQDPVEEHRREHERLRRLDAEELNDGRAPATRRANEVVADRETEISAPRPV
jgi:hypothetical protein